MDFDWSLFEPAALDPEFAPISEDDVAQSFEDGFSLRFIAAGARFALDARFFCLGATRGGHLLFSVYMSSGSTIKVLTARPMDPDEVTCYMHHRNKV